MKNQNIVIISLLIIVAVTFLNMNNNLKEENQLKKTTNR